MMGRGYYKVLYRCSKCGRRSTIDMIKPNIDGRYQCKLCLKRGVVFYPEYR